MDEIRRVLVANRGEVAIRVMRAAAEQGMHSLAVFAEDDADALHVRRADEVLPLAGQGAAAYLDADQIIEIAQRAGAQAIHPGYGFLSENAAFARRCERAGVRFVGPSPETLEVFGDKVRARDVAARCKVPLLAGSAQAVSIEQARDFFAALPTGGAMVIKALAGGGGRGMRVVRAAGDVDEAFARCSSEAESAFGVADVFVEVLLERARHVEVQVLGDGAGNVVHLHERECSLQRRHQKLVEIAPSPTLPTAVKSELLASALRMAREMGFRSLGTFEFLVDDEGHIGEGAGFAFMEANPRLQVEHTVTEEVTGVDLVQAQLAIAAGRTLSELGLEQDEIPPPRGHAIQLRINLETMDERGEVRPSGGVLDRFDLPSGPGVRVDTHGYAGYRTNPRYDSLIAKLIVSSVSADYASAAQKAYRALCELRIEGAPSNVPVLQSLLARDDVRANRVHTRFVDEHAASLVADASHPALHFGGAGSASSSAQRAGASIDGRDPLAVLDHGRAEASRSVLAPPPLAADAMAIAAPMQGTIVSVDVAEGELIRPGQQVLVMEAMKMEHVVRAADGGRVLRLLVSPGEAVFEGAALIELEEAVVDGALEEVDERVDLDHIRADLAEVRTRHEIGLDAARPEAVARRRKTGHRTARENIADLCDEGSFSEYGPLVIAAQRRRRELQDLIENTPADGMVGGIGSINGDLFAAEQTIAGSPTQCVVVSYDYTVLAGTQGAQNHRKKDRLFEIAEQRQLPLVFFTEGGGGRPGDTDGLGVAGLDCLAFQYFGRLSGLVPLVGINAGRCFAGNAALLGCCDVVISTLGSNVGMGGPAMIEGGGLGIFRPDEVGPIDVQRANGVVDIVVEDDVEAVSVARKYLSYFQGVLSDHTCADQRLLRSVIPENRLRIYDVRRVVELLADSDSVLELRRDFGAGMVTALMRIEGRPMGVIANNPAHLAGAIDSDGADKAARFMQLCDGFDLPILFLCDTPGIMVGPEAEKTGLVRHASRMFVTSAGLDVPFFTVVLRKGYGLGAQAMAGGSFKAPIFTVSWPTGEFGGMGLEGAVKLGYRKELAAVEDPDERRTLFETMVARMYAHGKAVNMASHFEIDDVIDPMETRGWIRSALAASPIPPRRRGKKRPCIDTW